MSSETSRTLATYWAKSSAPLLAKCPSMRGSLVLTKTQSATFSGRCSCKQMPRAHKARHKTESFRLAEPGRKLRLQPRQCSRPDLAHPAFVYAEPDADLFHGPFLEIIKAENMPVTGGECADGPVENPASFRHVCQLLRVGPSPWQFVRIRLSRGSMHRIAIHVAS